MGYTIVQFNFLEVELIILYIFINNIFMQHRNLRETLQASLTTIIRKQS
jgi:hypothetical protein